MSRLRELLNELRARQAADLEAADAGDRERWLDEGGSPASPEPLAGIDRT